MHFVKNMEIIKVLISILRTITLILKIRLESEN